MTKDNHDERELVEKVSTLINRDRVLAFSDAIFAFAATLLVLKIDLPTIPPELIEANLGTEIIKLWPQYFANLVSFFVISFYWLTHHAIFNMIRRYNHTLIWMNVIFLIFISFLPFPVDLFGTYSTSRAVVIFYSTSLALAGYLLLLLWLYASHNHRLVDKSLSQKRINFYTAKNFVAPVIFTFSIPLAFIDASITKFSWLFIIVGIILVQKAFRFRQVDAIEQTSL